LVIEFCSFVNKALGFVAEFGFKRAPVVSTGAALGKGAIHAISGL
jgi:hypothetical protein